MDKSTLTKMMPDYYQTSAVVENLNSVNATELNKAMLRFESVANQFFVQSADLSLDRWERELGLVIANCDDSEKRVVKIIGKTHQTVTQSS